MSGLENGFIAFGALLLLLAGGIPVAFAMATVAAVGIWLTVGTKFLTDFVQPDVRRLHGLVEDLKSGGAHVIASIQMTG